MGRPLQVSVTHSDPMQPSSASQPPPAHPHLGAEWRPLSPQRGHRCCVCSPPRMGDPHVPQFLLQVNFLCVRRLWKWNRPSCLELGLLASVWLLSGREDAQGTAQLYLLLPFYGEIRVWGALPGAPPGAPWSFHLVFSTSRAERSSLSSCS